MKKSILFKTQVIVFSAVGILLFVTLFLLATTKNIEVRQRSSGRNHTGV